MGEGDLLLRLDLFGSGDTLGEGGGQFIYRVGQLATG